jgi:hypothetical protein
VDSCFATSILAEARSGFDCLFDVFSKFACMTRDDVASAGQSFMINCDVAVPQLLRFVVEAALEDVTVCVRALWLLR